LNVVQVVVAVGGNVGDVRETLRRARKLIEAEETVHKLRAAELYRSVAMGADAGDSFLNSAWVFETSLDALELLDLLQRAENELGRTREVRWGPRTLDLDLIFYGEEQIDSPRLTVPHPHCWYRQFVLAPVASLIPDFRHPVFGLTVKQLYERITRFPLPVGYFGEPDNRFTLSSITREFPHVDLRCFDPASDTELAEVSLALWFGSGSPKPESPTCLPVPAEVESQFFRDVLTAACMDVEPVD
jgi:2-amino-4-hydroxy-6-hydroxymethyldihydropteridine diphosphokinase